MKKTVSLLCAAILVLSLLSAAAVADDATEEPVSLTDWAYAGITLDSEDLGIGSVYYASGYFDRDGIINPLTVEAYTAEGLKAIVSGAVEDAEGYVSGIPAEAVVGVSTYETGIIYWYDAENAEKILASADALILNTENGELSNLAGEAVASALPALENWAYAGITLNSEELGVGSVYYTEEFLAQDGRINPLTVAPFTAEELAAIKAGAVFSARAYTAEVPAEALIGISVCGSENICWFDAENAAGILSSSDPLVLNAETGEVSNLAGEVVATSIA